MLQLIRGITAFSKQVSEMSEKRTGQILCEMSLIYTKFEIHERICKSKESKRKVRNKGEDAFLAMFSSFQL